MNICRIKLATGFCKFNLFLNVCYVVYVVMKNLIEQFKNWIYVQLFSSESFYRSQSGIDWRCVYCVGTLYDELTHGCCLNQYQINISLPLNFWWRRKIDPNLLPFLLSIYYIISHDVLYIRLIDYDFNLAFISHEFSYI